MPSTVLLAATGVLSSTAGLTAMMAAAVPEPNSVPAYLFGGGATVVLAGVVGEVTRRLLNGSLIPRVIREAEAEQGANIAAAGQREARLMKIAEDAQSGVSKVAEDLRLSNARLAAELAERTDRQAEHLTRELAALVRTVEDLRDEAREHRRGQQ